MYCTCGQTGGVTTISMDANFGLVRKHNFGTSPSPSTYSNEFFVDPKEVNTFVTNYGSDNQKDKILPQIQLLDLIFVLIWKI